MSDVPPYPALAGADDPLAGIDASVPSMSQAPSLPYFCRGGVLI